MLTRWYDIEREMAALDELQGRMSRFFGGFGYDWPTASRASLSSSTWPRASLYDAGSSLEAIVEVPGLGEKELRLEVHGDVLTVSGERKNDAPEGYRVHRSERASYRFSRSFGLPCHVDAEKTKAVLRDGLLTITMEKHADAKPRQITVSAK
jgi:HSP20 family protein